MERTRNKRNLYLPLSLEDKEIRLLVLLPGQHHDELVCHMKTVPLHITGAYEALSYAWGNAYDDREDILLDRAEYDIAHNLAQALRHLRSDSVPRILWVDALCISQSNTQERTAQVRLMAEIYSAATRTVVWLGAFARPGLLAMDLIHRVAVGEVSSTLFDAEYEQARESMRLVLLCPWWQRVWIIQELAQSQGDPVLYCGTSSLPWSEFVKFWDITTSMKIKAKSNDPREVSKWQQLAAHIAPLRLMREWPSTQRSWARLVLLTSHYLATDPRDRIFALHGILGQEVQAGWLPDYEFGTAETFTSFTRYMIQSQGLDILCYEKPRMIKDLPSWVPDYSTVCSLVDAGGADFLPEEISDRADAGTSQVLAFGNDGTVLRIRGYLLGQIQSFIPSGQEIGMKEVLQRSNELLSLSRNRASLRNNTLLRLDSHRAGLGEILCCRSKGYQKEYEDRLNELLTGKLGYDFMPKAGAGLGQREQDILPILQLLFDATKRHRFFATFEGFCGMGHPDARIDDEIILVPGCARPLIVRLQNPCDGHSYRFVGSCGVPDIAPGQLCNVTQPSKMYHIY